MATDRRRSPTGVGAILEDILARIDPYLRSGLCLIVSDYANRPFIPPIRQLQILLGLLLRHQESRKRMANELFGNEQGRRSAAQCRAEYRSTVPGVERFGVILRVASATEKPAASVCFRSQNHFRTLSIEVITNPR